jgi:hypothetical protein
MKDLYSENYKILKKETEDIRRWKTSHLEGRLNIVNMGTLPTAL